MTSSDPSFCATRRKTDSPRAPVAGGDVPEMVPDGDAPGLALPDAPINWPGESEAKPPPACQIPASAEESSKTSVHSAVSRPDSETPAT